MRNEVGGHLQLLHAFCGKHVLTQQSNGPVPCRLVWWWPQSFLGGWKSEVCIHLSQKLAPGDMPS